MVNIVTCSDDNYADYCGVLFLSILKHNAEADLTFYLVESGMSEVHKAELTALVNRYGKRLEFFTVTPETFADCPIREGNHVSLATYYRLLMSEFFPQLDRVLYLDCDIVVRGDLLPLWDTNLGNAPFAAVLEGQSAKCDWYNRLRYPRHFGYVNAGVLLMNLRLWREQQLGRRCLDAIASNPDLFICHDQDCINLLFHETKLLLPFRYNVQDTLLREDKDLQIDYPWFDEIHEAVAHPVIIHYSGPQKPWHFFCFNPFTPIFLDLYKEYTGHPLKPIDPRPRNWQYYARKVIGSLGLHETVKRILRS